MIEALTKSCRDSVMSGYQRLIRSESQAAEIALLQIYSFAESLAETLRTVNEGC